MYHQRYAEVLEDDQTTARQVEARALDHAATMLLQAADLPPQSKVGIQALHFTRQLWTTFITELVAPENELPQDVRANLVSIGIWILKEADAIRLGTSTNYAGIADICAIVRDGLR